MRLSKVVGAVGAEDETFECIVLDEVGGDRHLVIQVGSSEAFSLAATLGGVAFGRPMTYQFMAALVESLGGRVRQVRIDRVVAGAYAATVEVDGSLGERLVDARPCHNKPVRIEPLTYALRGRLELSTAIRWSQSRAAMPVRVFPPAMSRVIQDWC